MKKILILFLFLSCSRKEIKQKPFDYNKENIGHLGICACNEGMKLHVVGTIISIDSLQNLKK